MSNTYVSLCDNVILNSIYYLKDFAHVSSLTNLCIYIYIYIYIHIPTASRTHFFFGCRSLALSAFIMPSLILCQMIDPRLGLHDTVGFAVPVRLEISKPMRRHSSHMHAIALMWGGGLVAPLAFWALDASSRWRQPAEPCPRAWRCRLRRMPPCLCEVHLSCGFPNVLCQQECHRAIRASPSGSFHGCADIRMRGGRLESLYHISELPWLPWLHVHMFCWLLALAHPMLAWFFGYKWFASALFGESMAASRMRTEEDVCMPMALLCIEMWGTLPMARFDVGQASGLDCLYTQGEANNRNYSSALGLMSLVFH